MSTEKWKIEDIFESEEYETVTIYIAVPKTFHNLAEKYPEAIRGTISMEFPKDHPEPEHVICRISPTKETPEGKTDYDWEDIDLDNHVIGETLDRYLRNDWNEEEHTVSFKVEGYVEIKVKTPAGSSKDFIVQKASEKVAEGNFGDLENIDWNFNLIVE